MLSIIAYCLKIKLKEIGKVIRLDRRMADNTQRKPAPYARTVDYGDINAKPMQSPTRIVSVEKMAFNSGFML